MITVAYFPIFTLVFIALAFFDVRYRIIPNKIVYPAAILAAILSHLLNSPGAISSLIGMALGLFLGVCVWILQVQYGGGSKPGAGDVKLCGLTGLVVGFPIVCAVLGISYILMGLIKTAFSIGNHPKAKEDMPLALYVALMAVPYLALDSLTYIF